MFPNIKQIKYNHTKIFPEYVYKLKFYGLYNINTKLSGCGAVIYKNNKVIWSNSFCSENAINNTHAEYMGLIYGLKKAYSVNIHHLIVESDSQIVINQMKGLYECNDENLIELYCKAKETESKFDKVCFNHIYANDNMIAHNLSLSAINIEVINK